MSLAAKAKEAGVDAAAVKVGLPPVGAIRPRLFILGSLPGDASLEARRYYAHPSNQFWRLLGGVLEEPLATLSYEDRLARLAERGVGLWDVIASAQRPGSLDQAIRSAEHNTLSNLLEQPGLQAIAFNGATAAKLGRALIATPPEQLTLVDLPSSSAANTRPLDEKAREWCRLAPFVAR